MKWRIFAGHSFLEHALSARLPFLEEAWHKRERQLTRLSLKGSGGWEHQWLARMPNPIRKEFLKVGSEQLISNRLLIFTAVLLVKIFTLISTLKFGAKGTLKHFVEVKFITVALGVKRVKLQKNFCARVSY